MKSYERMKPVKWTFHHHRDKIATFDPVQIVLNLARYSRPDLRIKPGKEYDEIICRHPKEIDIIFKSV